MDFHRNLRHSANEGNPDREIPCAPKERHPRRSERGCRCVQNALIRNRNCLGVPVATAGLAGTAGGAARTRGLPGGGIVGGNLAATRSSAAGIRVLAGPRPRAARFVLVLVVFVFRAVSLSGAAVLLRSGLIAAHLRVAIGLIFPSRLGVAAGLILASSRSGTTRFRLIRHRIAPRKPPLHFVRTRSGGDAWDAPE